MYKYSKEQLDWMLEHSQTEQWENLKAFTHAFNLRFGLDKSVSAISTVLNNRGIKINSKCNKGRMTKEQLEWIKGNLTSIEWRNQKHFTDTFNALFGTNISTQNMNQILCWRGWRVSTKHNTSHWTDEMDKWLVENYEAYDCYFVRLAKDFNEKFGTDKSACCITKHLERMGVHKPLPKGAIHHHGDYTGAKRKSGGGGNRSGVRNRGMFERGMPSKRGELPLGTIRYNSDGRPFIKVKLCKGEAAHKSDSGHNYREPWWKPLQKKIWEDHYGEVPEGYVVCSLNGNPNDTDIKNIGIIDKRGTAVMAKKGWWTDNRVITGDGAQWCNLYYTAKDHGIMT